MYSYGNIEGKSMNFIVLRDLVFVCLLASFPRDWGLH